MPDNYRSIARSDDRVIAGVVGGLAQHFDLEPTILRLATIFFVVATGLIPGVAAYAAGVVLMPTAGTEASTRTREAAVSGPADRTSSG